MCLLGCLMGLTKRSCLNWLHDPLLPTLPVLLSLPYCSQWYHYSPSILESFLNSLSYTLHPSSPSTNSACASLKIYPESDYLLPPPFLPLKSKTPSSLTWIATIVVSCSPCFVPSVCFAHSSQSPVSKWCCPITPKIKRKSIPRPCVIRHTATCQTLSPNTLPLSHCPPATVVVLIFLHHVKMFLPPGPLDWYFLCLDHSSLSASLLHSGLLLKCHFLRQLSPRYLM